MKINARLRLQILIQNSLFVVLLVGITGVIIYLAQDVKTSWDLTQSKRNTLSQATVDTLKQITQPIHITAFATTDAEGDLRQPINDFITPYQRTKGDITLSFVDPREDPMAAREAGIRVNGELVVELGGRKDNLRTLNEQELTNLLVRLMRTSERSVNALDGHGEGKLDGGGNFDLGDLGKKLAARGFRSGVINFAVAQDIPHNTSVLVVAAPRVDLLAGEAKRIRRYLEQGGNLLWLVDYDSLHGMDAVADYLGLDLIDGVVIDPRAGAQRLPASFSIAFAYGEHPVTNPMSINTVFPYARRIAVHEGSEFHFTSLVEVAEQGWLETSSLKGASFDENEDLRGPITVVGALERDVGNKRQRVVVVGSSRALTNEYIGSLGNMDLAMNIVNWVAGDDSLISIEPKTRIDMTLEMSRPMMAIIAFGFLIILPIALLGASGAIWWRRRRS